MEHSSDLDFRSPAIGAGIVTHLFEHRKAVKDGIALRCRILLGAVHGCTYFAQMQDNDPPAMWQPGFPNGCNRLQGLFATQTRGLRDGGLFALIQTPGAFLALLPLTAPETMCYMQGSEEGFDLTCATMGPAEIQGQVPLLAWACADQPYEAIRRAWLQVFEHPVLGRRVRPRQSKQYPRIFEYLGWCSYEEYRKNIDEATLVQAADAIGQSRLPIRFLLVDEGHMDQTDGQLRSFELNEKFPHRWQSLMDACRQSDIWWTGLWLNLNGLWNAFAPENDFGALNAHLAEYQWLRPGEQKARRIKMPAQGWLASRAVYEAMVQAAIQAGFDFVKVDDQAQNIDKYTGQCNAVAKGAENQQALEASCALHSDGLINCMAHNPVCIFNTTRSAVTRCSEDYLLGSIERARRHLHNSYMNMAVLGPSVWGDHDMFHSNDPVAGRIMARSKALSGGPIYLSDNPSQFVRENIEPLCFEDGRLLRPLAPAAPLPESLLLDPFRQPKAFRTIAPLPNGAAAVLCYNLTEPEIPLEAHVDAADHVHGGAMLGQGQEWITHPNMLLYDADAARAQVGGSLTRRMDTFSDWLVLLCPIVDNWALIGAPEKFLSPAGCEILKRDNTQLLLRLCQPQRVLIWRGQGGIHCPSACVEKVSEGLWSLCPSGDESDLILHILARE